jgi:hypothetical protein
LATSATGDRSASCNIRTICSSVNLARFITAPQVRGAIVSKSPWSENRGIGHTEIKRTCIFNNLIHDYFDLHFTTADKKENV